MAGASKGPTVMNVDFTYGSVDLLRREGARIANSPREF